MNVKLKKMFPVLASALVVSAPLAAQEPYTYSAPAATQQTYTPYTFDDRYYITPFGSYTFGDSSRRTNDGWGGGLIFGKPITEYLDLELQAMYSRLLSDGNDNGVNGAYNGNWDMWDNWRRTGGELPSSFYQQDFQDIGLTNGIGDFNIWDIGVNAVYRFRREGFQPFLLAGIGAINDKFSAWYGLGELDRWSFMANAGLGFLYPITDYALFRFDARYRYDNNNANFYDAGGFNDWYLAAGVQIPLGSKPVAPVAAAPVTRTIELSADALFAFDRYTLSQQGMNELDRFMQELGQASYSSIQVVGHTDPLGSEAYNMQLSDRRAAAVMDYLVSRGVPPDRISAVGRGESQLKVTEADCAGVAGSRPELIKCFQPNRRVEVTVTGAAPVTGTGVAPQ